MQSFMFLACFVQKVSKKNLWGVRTPFGKERVKPLRAIVSEYNLQSLILNSICQVKIGAILLTLHKQTMKALLK